MQIKLFSSQAGALRKGLGVTRMRPGSSQGQPKYMELQDVDGLYRKVHIIDMPGDAPHAKTLVILGGAAQTLFSWMPHYRDLLKGRRLIIPEMRCQGKTELLAGHATIPELVGDFRNLMQALDIEKTDLAGFSYGGRVALGVAAHAPELVNKISVTGVAMDRGGLGNCILESWKVAFKNNNMEEAAWSFVLNGYSAKFLEENEDKIRTHVDMVCKSNDVRKLASLYTHKMEDTDPYSLRSCVELLGQGQIKNIQIMAGLEDRICHVDGTRAISEFLRTNPMIRLRHEEMMAGHLLPFEKPRQWRSMLLSFLDDDIGAF